MVLPVVFVVLLPDPAAPQEGRSVRVLLIDVGSVIPNLALMQLSAWHKSQGDSVDLVRMGGRFRVIPLELCDSTDRAYVSVVFTWQRELAETVVEFLGRRGIPTEIGGTGIDWDKPRAPDGTPLVPWSRLPPEVDASLPDYALYGDRRAIGFCQRGCDRKCHFCFVWRKEGTIRKNPYRPPWTWVPDRFDRALLLDNDMALYPYERQAEIIGWFHESGVRYSITQGYDIRCVAQDDRLARLVADTMPQDLKFRGRRLYTAWDYIGIEPFVKRGLRALLDAGIRAREICCYMVCGAPDPVTGQQRPPELDHAEALHRFRVLREFGVYPYVMPYNKRTDDQWLNRFARYVNRCVFTSVPWEEYDRRAHEAAKAGPA
jgi:hypothetical protein